MGSKRNFPVQVYLESQFEDFIRALAEKNDTTVSGYIRQLVIDDLMKRDLLSKELLVDVLRK